jgi:hypothetical protein
MEIRRGRVARGEADIEGRLELGLEVGLDVEIGREFRSGGIASASKEAVIERVGTPR